MSPGKRGSGGGKISRRTALALIGLGGAGALGASGAFSSSKGSRRFGVGTADDSQALLRLESTTRGDPPRVALNSRTVSFTDSDGEVVEMVIVGNFVGEQVDFTALRFEPQSSDSPLSIQAQDSPSSLADRTEETLSARISCSSIAENEPVDLVVVAEGQETGTRVELTRSIEVTCTKPLCDGSTDLVAIRGNTETEVGTVNVLRTHDNRLDIDISLSTDREEAELKKTRIDVRTDPCDIPTGFGQYRFEAKPDSSTYSLSVDLGGPDRPMISTADPIVVAVRTTVSGFGPAWAKGPTQPSHHRRMYYDCGGGDGVSSCGTQGSGDNGNGEGKGQGNGNGNGQGNGNGNGNGNGQGNGNGNGNGNGQGNGNGNGNGNGQGNGNGNGND
jgi:hypothetical protein